MREAIIERLRLKTSTKTELLALFGYDWIIPMGELIKAEIVEHVFGDDREDIYRLVLGSEVQ